MAEEERWLDKLKLGQAKLAIVEEHHIDSGVEQRMPLKGTSAYYCVLCTAQEMQQHSGINMPTKSLKKQECK